MINSILRLVGGRRPLLVFGLPGVVVLLVVSGFALLASSVQIPDEELPPEEPAEGEDRADQDDS